jgi:hypothetical protein
MTLEELFERCGEVGLNMQPGDDGKILLAAPCKPPDELLDAVGKFKPVLLTWMTAEPRTLH